MAHFITAKNVLLFVMRKLEEASTQQPDLEAEPDVLDYTTLCSLKFDVLRALQAVSLYIPPSSFFLNEQQDHEDELWQRILLAKLANRQTEAQQEQRLLRFCGYYMTILRCTAFIWCILFLWTWIEGVNLAVTKGTLHGVVMIGECWFMVFAWTALMVGWKSRRKTFPVYVASLMIFAGHSVYDEGLAAFNWRRLAIVGGAVCTVPVLYYEVMR
ncbi:hypothetical protein N7537_005476 [Penicillium hordei]|uniref:Uncharacterized protein n=1 Tax=Penicillium hordei TaxID=40994 RepID=A0AAD6E5R3_9EURO|nr:uncharacterized protein N7537_005476 [Penicillium hordei]KAJ5602520.1 hypothetical protein N7537_005476 [Penicillium hordei]